MNAPKELGDALIAEAREDDKEDARPPTPAERASRFVSDYRRFRMEAANRSHELTEAELARTALRSKIVGELMDGGLKVTAATEQARTTPEYVKVTKEISALTLAWEVAFTDAEHARMSYGVITMQHLDQVNQQTALTELERLQSQIESRIREVKT